MIEIKLLVDKKIVIESLKRIGVVNRIEKILYPSCYLFENEDKYYIAHFKELFMIVREDAYSNITDDDIARMNAISFCLKKWKLIDVADEDIEPHTKRIFVLPYHEKKDWKISHKFNMRLLEKG